MSLATRGSGSSPGAPAWGGYWALGVCGGGGSWKAPGMPFAGPLDGLPEPRHQILGLGLGALDAGDAQPHPVPALGGLERGPGMNQGLHK
ncbi:hypothetical protein, partial [Meiothermus taiwanensis]|uniref:hypothetical protein n=1 Tax=Meiothermus taiwanensis TaxID=172827 RepID=UPI001CBA9D41